MRTPETNKIIAGVAPVTVLSNKPALVLQLDAPVTPRYDVICQEDQGSSRDMQGVPTVSGGFAHLLENPLNQAELQAKMVTGWALPDSVSAYGALRVAGAGMPLAGEAHDTEVPPYTTPRLASRPLRDRSGDSRRRRHDTLTSSLECDFDGARGRYQRRGYTR